MASRGSTPAVLVAMFVLSWPAVSMAGPDFAVIANAQHRFATVQRIELDRVYRRLMRFWPDGSLVLPVNLPFESPLRQDFSQRILRARAESLATFWNRRYFHGVLPPPVLKSPQAVRAYVAATPGAIGYIPRALL